MTSSILADKKLTAKERGKLNEAVLPIARLRELLEYDYQTGSLIWLVRTSNRVRVGQAAGYLNERGYLVIKIEGNLYLAHRTIWAIHYGIWPIGELDHINGIRNDNSIANLREVSRTENNCNMKRRRDNTSGVTGVYWSKQAKKWMSYISVRGERTHLGLFDSFENAVAARKAAEVFYGYHPNHGRSEQKQLQAA